MQKIDEKETKIRRFSLALIAKLDKGVLLNRQALRYRHESLTVSEWLSEILQDAPSCSVEIAENNHPGS